MLSQKARKKYSSENKDERKKIQITQIPSLRQNCW
jgi:hypothetical protein